MTWTYAGDPALDALSAIRFVMGDTDTNDQLINDEEINWTNVQVSGTSTSTDSIYEVAMRCCLAVAAKFARLADQSIGDFKVSLSQKAVAMRAQADAIKNELVVREGGVPTPYAGGISISDKDIDELDSDRVDPSFAMGQFRNIRAGNMGILSNSEGADY